MKLYDALTPWYRLVDPPEDHLDEATVYGDALERGAIGPVRTMLELGSGGSAVFAPDFVRETFADTAQRCQGDAADRALRGLEWSCDPSPDDCS